MKHNTATTVTTTVTAKNSSRILFQVINQISQKFSLTSEAKKQLTDFVAQKMTGEIKAVFPKELPDGDFDYATFEGQEVITVAYGDNCLYVVTRVLPKKEYELKEEMKEKFILDGLVLEKVLNGTVERVKTLLKVELNMVLTDVEVEKFHKFLRVQKVNGRIGVILTPILPKGDGYSQITLHHGDYDLEVVFGVNPVENNYPNVLWVKSIKSEKTRQREYLNKRMEKFRVFWENRGLPAELFEETVKNGELSEPFTIEVFKNFNEWDRKRKLEKGELIYIGQQPNQFEKIILNKPVVYMKGNHVCIVVPGFSLNHTFYVFD